MLCTNSHLALFCAVFLPDSSLATYFTSGPFCFPPSPSLSPLQEICINMHDLNKSIRVNNATRQPQQQQQPGMGPPPGGMGYGPARGEDPAAQARRGLGLPLRSADTVAFNPG